MLHLLLYNATYLMFPLQNDSRHVLGIFFGTLELNQNVEQLFSQGASRQYHDDSVKKQSRLPFKMSDHLQKQGSHFWHIKCMRRLRALDESTEEDGKKQRRDGWKPKGDGLEGRLAGPSPLDVLCRNVLLGSTIDSGLKTKSHLLYCTTWRNHC